MIFTEESVRLIRTRMETRAGAALPGPVDVRGGEGLHAVWRGGRGLIEAEDPSALARGFFLILRAVKSGKDLDVRQRRSFRSCGPFVDCSRGAVMTVRACKEYIDTAAALGMNVLALYLEDTYTVPEYPHFGYLRGRYTPEELKEIDDYCAGYGIELLPCIQTLAHLEQFLQWDAAGSLSDTPSCLMAGSGETYAFIDAAVASLRRCVRTKRLHVGMDEAHDVGLGRYLKEHGPSDRFTLLTDHLARVCDICRKYGFEPMMWSDMFFRLGSRTGDYYDPDAHVPQSVIARIPEAGMVYWDYYHTDEDVYERMYAEHVRMGRPVIFAGGNWTWSGFLPHVKRTDATMYPAMRVCVRHRADTVLATMWGDDGNETDVFLADSQLPVFSEACWLGEDMTREGVRETAAALTGLPPEVYDAFGEFNADEGEQYTGKAIVCGDLLLPVLPGYPDLRAAAERAERALRELEACPERSECRYAAALFRLVKEKAEAIPAIRNAYLLGDRCAVRAIAEDTVPRLIRLTESLEEVHRERWERYYKPEGWEIFPQRYGAMTGRLKDVRRALLRWADGETDTVPGLDAERLPNGRRGGQRFMQLTTTHPFGFD